MKVTEVKREFVFERENGKVITLADINPSMKHDEIIAFHSSNYPELISAVLAVKNLGDTVEYRLKEKLGTKG